MNILIDMNLSPQWCEVFVKHGWTSKHWSQIGSPDAPDTTLMAWAQEHHHLIFTHDLDFGALLAASQKARPSVIQIRGEDIHPQSMANTLCQAIEQCQTDLQNGALISIDARRTRVRILPL